MMFRVVVALLALVAGGAVVVHQDSTSSPGTETPTLHQLDPLAALAPPVQFKGVVASNVDSHNFGGLVVDVIGATLPTVVNTTYVKASTGPVVATWTGELLGTDSSSDVVMTIDAAEYDVKTGTVVDTAVIGLPSIGGTPSRNYSLRTNNSGFGNGTSTAQVIWPAGGLKKGKVYQFNVRLAEFSGPSTTSTRLSTLTVQAYKK